MLRERGKRYVLVNNYIVGSGPGDPSKVTESGDDENGEPRPQEHGGHDDHEPLVARHGPSIGCSRVGFAVIMQSIHETDVDKSARPDHGSRLDKELSDGASKTKTASKRYS